MLYYQICYDIANYTERKGLGLGLGLGEGRERRKVGAD